MVVLSGTSMLRVEANVTIVQRNANRHAECRCDRLSRGSRGPGHSWIRPASGATTALKHRACARPSAFVLHLTPIRSQRTNQSRENRDGAIPTDWFIPCEISIAHWTDGAIVAGLAVASAAELVFGSDRVAHHRDAIPVWKSWWSKRPIRP
ncbi:protein of unknown function [Bradyrhizobium vignae]|uniref:Uncharacterized protein n=1 Tax=Bradyrhizobium vignae TaxID=1549949 RepID=A0A2U3Q116_9BRAD|nr:protein of unknown function [Bradyrhizobium vignae]